jgi:hypothetical protein
MVDTNGSITIFLTVDNDKFGGGTKITHNAFANAAYNRAM